MRTWGEENAMKVCRISVFVTDTDQVECTLLKTELSTSKLYKSGAIHFCRPDSGEMTEGHTLE